MVDEMNEMGCGLKEILKTWTKTVDWENEMKYEQ